MENKDLTKKLKELRKRKGLSQDQLAEKSGLSLRTIQRIENGETVPRADTLNRFAVALEIAPNEIFDWQMKEDKNVLIMLHLSQLAFLAFPLLGVILPLAIWILKKERVIQVDPVGKSILNFQISWVIVLFTVYAITGAGMILHVGITNPVLGYGTPIAMLYAYNILIILINTYRSQKEKSVKYKPAVHFLR